MCSLRSHASYSSAVLDFGYCMHYDEYEIVSPVEKMQSCQRSGKTGLIAHDSRFDFSPRTQRHMNELSNFIITKVSARLQWSAFAGYFSQAQW